MYSMTNHQLFEGTTRIATIVTQATAQQLSLARYFYGLHVEKGAEAAAREFSKFRAVAHPDDTRIIRRRLQQLIVANFA
jgi:hypothetical protein